MPAGGLLACFGCFAANPSEQQSARSPARCKPYQSASPAADNRGAPLFSLADVEKHGFGEPTPTLLLVLFPGQPCSPESGGAALQPDIRVFLNRPAEVLFDKHAAAITFTSESKLCLSFLQDREPRLADALCAHLHRVVNASKNDSDDADALSLHFDAATYGASPTGACNHSSSGSACTWTFAVSQPCRVRGHPPTSSLTPSKPTSRRRTPPSSSNLPQHPRSRANPGDPQYRPALSVQRCPGPGDPPPQPPAAQTLAWSRNLPPSTANGSNPGTDEDEGHVTLPAILVRFAVSPAGPPPLLQQHEGAAAKDPAGVGGLEDGGGDATNGSVRLRQPPSLPPLPQPPRALFTEAILSGLSCAVTAVTIPHGRVLYQNDASRMFWGDLVAADWLAAAAAAGSAGSGGSGGCACTGAGAASLGTADASSYHVQTLHTSSSPTGLGPAAPGTGTMCGEVLSTDTPGGPGGGAGALNKRSVTGRRKRSFGGCCSGRLPTGPSGTAAAPAAAATTIAGMTSEGAGGISQALHRVDEGLLRRLFALEPAKYERMMHDTCVEARVWRGIIRVTCALPLAMVQAQAAAAAASIAAMHPHANLDMLLPSTLGRSGPYLDGIAEAYGQRPTAGPPAAAATVAAPPPPHLARRRPSQLTELCSNLQLWLVGANSGQLPKTHVSVDRTSLHSSAAGDDTGAGGVTGLSVMGLTRFGSGGTAFVGEGGTGGGGGTAMATPVTRSGRARRMSCGAPSTTRLPGRKASFVILDHDPHPLATSVWGMLTADPAASEAGTVPNSGMIPGGGGGPSMGGRARLGTLNGGGGGGAGGGASGRVPLFVARSRAASGQVAAVPPSETSAPQGRDSRVGDKVGWECEPAYRMGVESASAGASSAAAAAAAAATAAAVPSAHARPSSPPPVVATVASGAVVGEISTDVGGAVPPTAAEAGAALPGVKKIFMRPSAPPAVERWTSPPPPPPPSSLPEPAQAQSVLPPPPELPPPIAQPQTEQRQQEPLLQQQGQQQQQQQQQQQAQLQPQSISRQGSLSMSPAAAFRLRATLRGQSLLRRGSHEQGKAPDRSRSANTPSGQPPSTGCSGDLLRVLAVARGSEAMGSVPRTRTRSSGIVFGLGLGLIGALMGSAPGSAGSGGGSPVRRSSGQHGSRKFTTDGEESIGDRSGRSDGASPFAHAVVAASAAATGVDAAGTPSGVGGLPSDVIASGGSITGASAATLVAARLGSVTATSRSCSTQLAPLSLTRSFVVPVRVPSSPTLPRVVAFASSLKNAPAPVMQQQVISRQGSRGFLDSPGNSSVFASAASLVQVMSGVQSPVATAAGGGGGGGGLLLTGSAHRRRLSKTYTVGHGAGLAAGGAPGSTASAGMSLSLSLVGRGCGMQAVNPAVLRRRRSGSETSCLLGATNTVSEGSAFLSGAAEAEEGTTSEGGTAGGPQARAAAAAAAVAAGGGEAAAGEGDDGDGEGECWHEVTVTRTVDPRSGAAVLLVTQVDVTAKVEAERHIALVSETEHRLLEQIFPRHVLAYMTEEGGPWAATESSEQQPHPAGWRPVVRDINKLATSHQEVTLLFADIQGFTPMCKVLEPRVIMAFLNDLFTRFDQRLDEFGVYKVETIGDCYFVAGGLVHEDADGMMAVRQGGTQHEDNMQHAERVFKFAQAMLSAASQVALPTTGGPVRVRIGIHSGPVVSGVVGQRMPRFCLFGDTVNTTSRMESTGVAGCIHASEAARRLLVNEAWVPSGGIEVKGRGLMETFLWAPPDADLDPEARAWLGRT